MALNTGKAIIRTKADTVIDAFKLTTMSDITPAVVKLLPDTEIPRRRVARGHPKPYEGPRGLRIVPPTTSSMNLLREVLVRTEATSPPIMSYEAMTTPLIPQSIGESATPSTSKSSNKPIVYESGYVTFPAYCKTTYSKPETTKIYARKIKSCLLNAAEKLLTGLQAAGDFYAYSEQKWESEYQPFERVTSNNTSILEAIEATNRITRVEQAYEANKHPRISWGKRLQNYWKPEPALQPSTNSILKAHNEEEGPIPPISTHLRKRNNQRPEYMQSSHQPIHPLRQGRTPQPAERIQLTRQPRYSPPEGRMYPLERQPRRAYCGSQSQKRHRVARSDASEGAGEDGDVEEDDHGDEEDLGTPWSGLQTVAEEGGLGEIGWGNGERWRDDEGIDRDGMACDGFEAGGELCLRHESCTKEAMALSAE